MRVCLVIFQGMLPLILLYLLKLVIDEISGALAIATPSDAFPKVVILLLAFGGVGLVE